MAIAISALDRPRPSSVRVSRSRAVRPSRPFVALARGRRAVRSEISRRVIVGASSDSPAATTRTAGTRASRRPAFGGKTPEPPTRAPWHDAYGVPGVVAADVLEQKAARASVQGVVHVVVLVERRQHQHPAVGLGTDGAGGLDAVEVRHADVEEGDVGMVFAYGRQRLEPVRCLGDHLDVGLRLEDHREATADEFLVVGDDDADAHAPTFSEALTRWPPPSSGPASAV